MHINCVWPRSSVQVSIVFLSEVIMESCSALLREAIQLIRLPGAETMKWKADLVVVVMPLLKKAFHIKLR